MPSPLAIEGGSPVRTDPFPQWPIYGEEEIELIAQIVHRRADAGAVLHRVGR